MLPWLHKKLNRRQLFFLQLALFVLFCHCVALISYFVSSRPSVIVLDMRSFALDFSRPIRVVPFVKRTGQLQRLRKSGAAAKGAPKNQVAKKIMTPLKKIEPFKKTATVAKKKPDKQLKKAVVPKEGSIKPLPKDTVPPKKIEKEVASLKPEVKPAEQKREEIQTITDSILVPEQRPLDEVVSSPNEQPIDSSDEEIVLGQQEFEALHIYQEVYQELSRRWHPPAGLHPKQAVIVLVNLGERGVILDMTVEQGSGVLVYDIAARMAVSKAQFPPELWNQKMRLHF